MIFNKDRVFIYWNWTRMIQGWSRTYLEIISVLETTSKVHVGSQNLIFHFFLKPSMFILHQKLIFGVTSLEINLVEYAHMDRTDHLGFRSNSMLTCSFKYKTTNCQKSNLLRLFPRPKWFLNIYRTAPESSRLNFHI